MKLSNSKRQLAEIIRASGKVWYDWFGVAMQDGDGALHWYAKNSDPFWTPSAKAWNVENSKHYAFIVTGEPIPQCHRTKLTRDEYMAYLAEFETPAKVEVQYINQSTSVVTTWDAPEQPVDTVPEFSSASVTVPASVVWTATLEKLITNWQEAKCTADHARSAMATLEQHERDAHAAVESRLLDVGWGSVSADVSQDQETWRLGDKFEVLGNCDPFHSYGVGEIVTMIAEEGREEGSDYISRIYENKAGHDQYVHPSVLRKL